jgi:hypothetical protein
MATRTPAHSQPVTTAQDAPDGFPIDENEPLAEQHRLLHPVMGQILKGRWDEPIVNLDWFKSLLKRPANEFPALTLAVMRRLVWHQDRFDRIEQRVSDSHWVFATVLAELLEQLLKKNPDLDEDGVRRFVGWLCRPWKHTRAFPWPGALSVVERYAARRPLDREMAADLQKLRRSQAMKGNNEDARAARKRLDGLLRSAPSEEVDDAAAPPLCVDPTDPWTRRAAEDLEAMPPAERGVWLKLLAHAATALTSKPAVKWMKKAAEHVQPISRDPWRETLGRWFALVG